MSFAFCWKLEDTKAVVLRKIKDKTFVKMPAYLGDFFSEINNLNLIIWKYDLHLESIG